jgi:Trk K+ transport system NAD-binding subunit
VVVDPNVDAATEVTHGIAGLATRANLEKAGIADAVGVIAATHSDENNLTILLTARSINPEAQLIVRQNSHENELAFNAASADLIMQPSLVTARRILLRLISPLIQDFLEYLEDQPELLSEVVLPALRESVDQPDPALWTVRLTNEEVPAVVAHIADRGSLKLRSLLGDPRDRSKQLNAVALMLKRGDECLVMPGGETEVERDDEILVCSTYAAESKARSNFGNGYTLTYLDTGEEPPRGWLMSRLLPNA